MDIQNLSEKWMPLKEMQLKGLREVLNMQHFAAQLIAVIGEHLIPERKDSSHTAMEFSVSRKMLIGEKIPADKPIRVGLNIIDLSLNILSSRLEVLQTGALNGHTTTEGFNFFKKHLGSYGVDISGLDLTLDYQLSTGPVKKEQSFEVGYPDAAEETVKYRANAKFLLQFFNRVFKHTSEIHIWPLDFCTSSVIYSGFDDKNHPHHVVSFGFSPQNDTINEPHYYVGHNADHDIIYPDPMPVLKGGGHWNRGEWKGAYLSVSDIWAHSNAATQFNMTSEFFASAIEASLRMMNV